jgi:hypothetical protein
MAAPEVPIEVDEASGVWTTDGLPMVYVPRHFFVNNHRAIEAALGTERYAPILHEAGHRSAWQWCEKEARTHGLEGEAVFRHYMRRLSQRGYGRFVPEALDVAAGTARIRVEHSIFVLEQSGLEQSGLERAQPGSERRCYMFAGWAPGALEWVRHSAGLSGAVVGEEVACAAGGHAACLLEARLAAKEIV